MVKKWGLVALLALVFTACAPQYTVRQSTDPVYGTSSTRLDLNTLTAGCMGCGSLELNIAKYTSAKGRRAYDLVVVYRASDWLFIERGQSLTLRVNNELVQLTTDASAGPFRDVGYGGHITETVYYPTTVELLRKIANASQVAVRVDGDRYYVSRDFRPENFENFKRFIAEHVD